MTFERFPEDLKETRSVPDAAVDLLLDQSRVQYGSDVIALCYGLVVSGLERRGCRIENAGGGGLDDREEDF